MCLLICTRWTHCNILRIVITALTKVKTFFISATYPNFLYPQGTTSGKHGKHARCLTISSSSRRNSQRTQPGTPHMTISHNIYAMFHGIFGRSFLYARCEPSVNLTYRSAANRFYVLWSARLYCMLEPKHVYFSARTSQRATKVILSKDENHALTSVVAYKENVKIKVKINQCSSR